MTNEELYLTRRLADALKVTLIYVVPRPQAGDDILLSKDGNPNTAGAKLLRVASDEPGAKLKEIAEGINSARIHALICLHEDATEIGATAKGLEDLPCLISLGMLPSATTKAATVVLPGLGFAEKRGSMINVKGRLQRLNRAIVAPGDTRDDWEILRDLILALTGSNGLYMVEDVFKSMANDTPALAGLSLSKIGDLGVQVIHEDEKKDVPKAADEKTVGSLPNP